MKPSGHSLYQPEGSKVITDDIMLKLMGKNLNPKWPENIIKDFWEIVKERSI